MMSCDIPMAIPEPTSLTHPHLAMLDEQTVLQVTGEESLSAVRVRIIAVSAPGLPACLQLTVYTYLLSLVRNCVSMTTI